MTMSPGHRLDLLPKSRDFLLSVVVSSNSSPLFLTNDEIRKNLWVFLFSLFLQQPTMQTTISTTALLHLFELVLITFEGHQHGG